MCSQLLYIIQIIYNLFQFRANLLRNLQLLVYRQMQKIPHQFPIDNRTRRIRLQLPPALVRPERSRIQTRNVQFLRNQYVLQHEQSPVSLFRNCHHVTQTSIQSSWKCFRLTRSVFFLITPTKHRNVSFVGAGKIFFVFA